MGRYGISLIASLLGLLLWSCCPDDPFTPTTGPGPVPIDSTKKTNLRVVIVAPEFDAGNRVEVLLGSEPLFTAPLGYLDYPEGVYEAQFWPVDTGSNVLTFRSEAGSTLASKQVQLDSGAFHTAYLYARADGSGYDVLLTSDEPTQTPGQSQVVYRVVNFAIGSPAVDVQFGDAAPIATDLGYGDTTALLTAAAPVNTKLTIYKSSDDSKVIEIPAVLLPSNSVNTLVLTGHIRPRGTERLFFLSILQDSRFFTESGLYGSLPLPPIELTALRFINLVPTGSQGLDVALRDPQFGSNWPDSYRRNFPGQREAVIDVKPLGGDPVASRKGYFFLSSFLYSELPYRIETHIGDPDPALVQPVLVPGPIPFPIAPGRFTIVAFGPNREGDARAVTLADKTPAPTPGNARIRLFHGAYQSIQQREIRARIGSVEGPLMGYGDAPDPLTESFEVPASASATVEIYHDAGTLVHTANGIRLDAGKTYTLFLSMGPDGNAFLLTAVDEDVVPE